MSHNTTQVSGGSVYGFIGSVISMAAGVVKPEDLAGALVISALCTITGFFINKVLKILFDGKGKKGIK